MRKAALATADHLRHLVGKYIKDLEERAALLKKCTDVKQRTEVLNRLDELKPGLRRDLEKLWTHSGGVALHLWRAPFLDSKSSSQLKGVLQKNLNITLKSGIKFAMPGKPSRMPGAMRVLWLSIDAEMLRCSIQLTIGHVASFHTDAEPYVSTVDVELAIDFHRPDRIIEVFSTTKNATLVLEFFIAKVLGTKVPTESRFKENLFKPVKFGETEVGLLENNFDMSLVEVSGDDATGEIGPMTLQGRPRGNRIETLRGTTKAKSQVDAKNDKRSLSHEVKHSDGFEEYFLTKFYVTARHPHLKFQRTTSRLAMRTMLDELLSVIKEANAAA